MPEKDSNNTQYLLRRRFPPEYVDQRQGPGRKMLDYIAIETVLKRLLNVVPDYNLEVLQHEIGHLPNGVFLATVTCSLEIDGKRVAGVGAHTNNDPDMAFKSAYSEAIKNAAKNGWGIGLYLWDQDERDFVQYLRDLNEMPLDEVLSHWNSAFNDTISPETAKELNMTRAQMIKEIRARGEEALNRDVQTL